MRLSKIQKDILFVLFALEQKGKQDPVTGMNLLSIINKGSSSELYDTNFRTSCHTLNTNKLVNKYRTSSLKLAWALTEAGRAIACIIFNERS